MPTIALLGNPNTGKTTLFNALTGLRQRVGNYPGVTVERKTGDLVLNGTAARIVDLPGTYSLAAQSPDEQVAVDLLLGRRTGETRIDGVVVIVDASNLTRNFYLVSQLLACGLPMVIALNMTDIAAAKGIAIDAARLAAKLGIPVIPLRAHLGLGIEELRAAIGTMLQEQRTVTAPPPLAALDNDAGSHAVVATARYQWVRTLLHDVVRRTRAPRPLWSDRLDALLTHKVAGSAIFLLLTLGIFQAIYTWAGPVMDAIGALVDAIGVRLGALLPDGALQSLVVDGIVKGVGNVLVFVPQIAILFFFLALLEDCGYMARAAFLMDKLFARIGLSGKSFIPFLSSFACAVPGIMATRTIENRRDRLATIVTAPLISCSARLPVYTIMIAAFIPNQPLIGGWLGLQGAMLFAMHCVGFCVAIPIVWLLKRSVLKGATPPFVMELPTYKRPSLTTVGYRVWDRSRAFVRRAGTIICALSILVWALAYFPHPKAIGERYARAKAAADATDVARLAHEEAGAYLRASAFGRMGQWIEPAVRPLGWDWRIGMAALASFPAREVIVAVLGTVYNLGGEVDETSEGLQSALRNATWPDGRAVFTIPVALSLMVFFALCCQCGATVAIIRREANSWGWAWFTFGYMTALAYGAALATYQGAMMLGS
ncbi:MAG: ferrous iron transporter B [Deltaproteobacteria bacterium]|nr:ferrous iron transporter B [Deltaproteobacteria bacterium]